MGRKRLLITLLLSLAIIFALRGFYAFSEPIKISFVTNTNKPVELQFFYTENSHENFSEKKSVRKKMPVGVNQKASVTLPAAKIHKLRIDFGANPGQVTFRRLRLDGLWNVKIRHFEGTFNQINRHEQKGNALVITSDQRDPYFVFKKRFDLPIGYNFDWKLLVIIATLSFLFSYKLVQYLAKFKIEEENSRIDIVFLCTFFVLLLIPSLKINPAPKSVEENRMLATYKPLFTGTKINYNFGKDFEAWFNDRFWGRPTVIWFHNNTKALFNRYYENKRAYIGKNQWAFGKGENMKRVLPADMLNAIGAGIDSFNKFCHQHNIKCYIEVVPRKTDFGKDNSLEIIHEDNIDWTIPLVKFLKEKYNYDLIYPRAELLAANKKDAVYFKTDHHWSEWGAYIGFQSVMTRIQDDFKDIKIVTEDDFNIFYDNRVRAEWQREFWHGSSFNMLNIDDRFIVLDQPYKYYAHKNEKELKVSVDEELFDKTYSYEKGAPHRAILMGNSFAENFSSFWSYQFRDALKIRVNNKKGDNMKLSRWKKQIIDYKPEILVIVIQSIHVRHLADLKN